MPSVSTAPRLWSDGSRLLSLATLSPAGAGYMTASPITNADVVPFLNALFRQDPRQDFRRLINLTSPNLPIRRSGAGFSCRADRLSRPAVGLTWFGAACFAGALGGRLPTAAEFWLSCRGLTTRYPWGDEEPTRARANFGHHHGGTTPVGDIGPHVLGFTDIIGNVYEWTSDWAPDGITRITVGGGWASPAQHLRIGFTNCRLPLMAGVACGFRVWLPDRVQQRGRCLHRRLDSAA